VVERRSVTGELSLVCTGPAADVTIYMGKPSAVGQPTRPTQPFIITWSINASSPASSAGAITVHSGVAPHGELPGKGGMVYLQCIKLCDPC